MDITGFEFLKTIGESTFDVNLCAKNPETNDIYKIEWSEVGPDYLVEFIAEPDRLRDELQGLIDEGSVRLRHLGKLDPEKTTEAQLVYK